MPVITTAEDCVLYLTECALATVEILADMRPLQPGELNRQCAIAQTGVEVIGSLGLVPQEGGRTAAVLASGRRVREWAKAGKDL